MFTTCLSSFLVSAIKQLKAMIFTLKSCIFKPWCHSFKAIQGLLFLWYVYVLVQKKTCMSVKKIHMIMITWQLKVIKVRVELETQMFNKRYMGYRVEKWLYVSVCF